MAGLLLKVYFFLPGRRTALARGAALALLALDFFIAINVHLLPENVLFLSFC